MCTGGLWDTKLKKHKRGVKKKTPPGLYFFNIFDLVRHATEPAVGTPYNRSTSQLRAFERFSLPSEFADL